MKTISLKDQAGPQVKAFVTDCGIIFLPATLFGNEQEIFLCCGYDGAEVVQHEGHIYAAADWLSTEFPEHRAQVSEIAKRIQQQGACYEN